MGLPTLSFFCQKKLARGRSTLPRGFLGSSALTGLSTWGSGGPSPQLRLGWGQRQKMRGQDEGWQRHNAWRLKGMQTSDSSACSLDAGWSCFSRYLEMCKVSIRYSFFPSSQLRNHIPLPNYSPFPALTLPYIAALNTLRPNAVSSH